MKPLSALQEWPSHKALLWIAGIALLAGGAFSWKLHSLDEGLAPYGIVRFEVAFSPSRAQRILGAWDEAAKAARTPKPPTGPAVQPLVGRAAARASLEWDFAFIFLGYAPLLFALTLLAARSASGRWKQLGFLLALGAGGAALCDVVENCALLAELQATADPPGALLTATAGGAAVIKFLLVAACAFYCLMVLSTRPWARDLGRLIRPVWLHIGIVVGLGLLLVFVGQTQDVIRALGESAAEAGPRLQTGRGVFWLLFATLLLGGSTWYWTRFLLSFKFSHSPGDTELLNRVATWLPRILGTAPFGFIGLAFFRAASASPEDAARLHLFADLSVLGGALFFTLVWKRRQLAAWLKARIGGAPVAAAPAAPVRPVPVQAFGSLGEHFDQEGMRSVLAASVLLGAALFLGFLFWPVWLGQRIGTGAIFLLTACFWIPLVSLILYAGFRYRIPLVRYALLGMVLFSLINDTHAVRALDGAPPPRKSVAEQLQSWHQAIDQRYPCEQEHPLYIVCAQGGGVRAAYWTAGVLGYMQDRSKGQFAPRVFAISGASGGSLGASVFAAEVAYGPGKESTYVDKARTVLSHDLLSPALGATFFPDLLQIFLPPVLPWDRAVTMERSWELAWEEEGEGRFGRDFFDLYRNGGKERPVDEVPSLFLNATLAETGGRSIISNLALKNDFPDAQDAFERSRLDLRLSTATLLSARFPIVTPAATLPTGEHLVDGGYFENSGCSTAEEILDVVLRARQELPKCGHEIRPVVLILTNSTIRPAPDDLHGQASSSPVLSGLLVPPQTMVNTQDARAIYAMRSLASKARHANVACRHIALEPGNGVDPPLGWMLSRSARQTMDDQVGKIDLQELGKCRDSRCSCDDLTGELPKPIVSCPTPR